MGGVRGAGGSRTVLVLGGTGEARRLAGVLVGWPGVRVVSSLAGRVRAPSLPPGEVRVGGFGGADGLRRYLAAERVDAVVDATHPFAARMTANAAAACTEVPLVVLRRPGWTEVPGDRWVRVPSLVDAASALSGLGERVLLTIGRQELAPFADCADHWFLIRAIEQPDPPLPARHEVLLDRGPYRLKGERVLLRERRIAVVVTKDSGGDATAAKLVAAREAGLPVVVVDRPSIPDGVTAMASEADVVAHLADLFKH